MKINIHRFTKLFTHWFLLIVILVSVIFVYLFELNKYLTFSMLQAHYLELEQWSQNHYWLTVILYMLIYITAIALSIPAGLYLTLTGGLLFGPLAILYVVISATTGATILFLAVRSSLGEWLEQRVTGWVEKLEKGFQENAFNYVLCLRLIHIVPFWVINIASALFDISLRAFVLATFIGIIPGTTIYVFLGIDLHNLLRSNQIPNFHIIFTPAIWLPLLGLAVLSLLPVIYHKWKGR